jgi:molecular chaperone GrpE
VENERQQQNAPDVSEPEAAGDGAQPDEAALQIASLEAERDQLAAEKAKLYDRLLRRQADFDNFRKRVERDRSEYIQFAAMDLIRELLPLLDDFERALAVETADREYARGVEMMYQRFFDTLKRMGLEPIETAGRTFDPNLHQALDREETDEVEDHAILQEYQKGYNFKGKLLRPSMVKVAVRP